MTISAIETGIIAQLGSKLVSVQVASGAAIASAAADIAKLAPIIFVQPAEAAVTSSSHDGTGIVEEQTWLVSIITEITPDADGLLVADYGGVDVLISSVLGALSGFMIAGAMGPCTYIGRDVPTIGAGLLEIILRFTVRVFIQS